MKTFEPASKTFNKRIWDLIKFRLFIYISILLLGMLFNLFASIVPFLMIIITYLRAYNMNRRYIEKIEINEQTNNLYIKVINKRDEIISEDNYLLSECMVKITELGNKITVIFQLEIYFKKKNSITGEKKLIAKQTTVGNWNLVTFIEIYKTIQEFKNEEIHIDWLNKRLKD